MGRSLISATAMVMAALLTMVLPAGPRPAAAEMQVLDNFAIDRTEVTIGAFGAFVAATGLVTAAERAGGGLVYGAGWERMAGWTWRRPFGLPAGAGEPAVHVTFGEAAAYCRWAGKRLPRAAEWLSAAYHEQRATPPPPFRRGRHYPYPTGDSPMGANCLGACGPTPAIDHSARLDRGRGHAPVGRSKAGVNGLYDMGANVWEWVDDWQDGAAGERRLTLGGSWWYGAGPMHRDHRAGKPPDMAVVYIGFRCAQDLRE